MRASKTIVPALLPLALALTATTAEAQRLLSTSLPCAAITNPLQCGAFGCGGPGGYIIIRNSLSSTIAAGTVYTYVFNNTQRTYSNPSALPAGGVLSIELGVGTPGLPGECTARIPGNPNIPLFGQILEQGTVTPAPDPGNTNVAPLNGQVFRPQ